MAHRRDLALSAAVAAACLTLGACGASRAPAAGSPPRASPTVTKTAGAATLTGHFCSDAETFMRHIPAGPTIKHASVTQERDNLRAVLRTTVKGFTALEAEAPEGLRTPLHRIVAVYRSDERIVRNSGSLAQISESMVKGNQSGSAAFQKVLKYIAVSCK